MISGFHRVFARKVKLQGIASKSAAEHEISSFRSNVLIFEKHSRMRKSHSILQQRTKVNNLEWQVFNLAIDSSGNNTVKLEGREKERSRCTGFMVIERNERTLRLLSINTTGLSTYSRAHESRRFRWTTEVKWKWRYTAITRCSIRYRWIYTVTCRYICRYMRALSFRTPRSSANQFDPSKLAAIRRNMVKV